jgi:hypothetical protein
MSHKDADESVVEEYSSIKKENPDKYLMFRRNACMIIELEHLNFPFF